MTPKPKRPRAASRPHSGGGGDGHRPFPIVGIGASAGGLEAFRQLLGNLPGRTGMGFILVQHLDPRHESKLVELLSKSSAIPLLEARTGLAVEPDHAYVIPPNSTMTFGQGLLHLRPREDRAPHLPIDHLFRSLAEDQRGHAIGVVLSGTGSDGTLGLCEIKAAGGVTFAQEEGSARHTGMPRSAIDSGCVDFVLAPEDIAARLAALGSHPYLAPRRPAQADDLDEDQFEQVLAAVRSATGVDFRLYRDTTIRRRILRRLALHAQESLADYIGRLNGDPTEVEALYHDLLINVTSFFRDPEVLEAIKARVLPEIAKRKAPSDAVRVWVPGCSTGQEAYSLAMVLAEFYDDKPSRPPVQIFATDLSDRTVLERARAGRYPESIEAEVPPDRLRRFFRKEDSHYRIDKSIRDACVFARQNLASDPPFSHVDIISCRNVLIYLSPSLQRTVVPTLHYALNVPGFLVLGPAESVGDHHDLFELVDKANKIYSKRAVPTRPNRQFSARQQRRFPKGGAHRQEAAPPSTADLQREADRVLLGRFVPPGVLVNERLDILQYRGHTSPYLEAPPGEPTTNVLKMLREGLFLELRNALTEARKGARAVRRKGVRLSVDGGTREIDLEVVPIRPQGAAEAVYLILFHDASARSTADVESSPAGRADSEPDDDGAPDTERELAHLRQELAATREYMQSLVEQQDAANEELRSANEEILSSNEELQSTNEELETAKEELQSTNEELTTVNEQLQNRNLDLSELNNDLTNILSSTDIPMVMVGGDLCVRRVTAPAEKVLSLLPSDVGRPIAHIRPAVEISDLEALIGQVIETVQPAEREVRDPDGRTYELRIFPYRTSDHRIDGAVIVLVDIDRRKRAEEALLAADRRKDEFLAILAHELRNPLAPIRNVVEILDRSGDDAEIRSMTRDVLRRQVTQLSRIVEDLVDVGRIVGQKIELRRELVPLANIVETAVETSRSTIESRRHRLSVELPRRSVYLHADPVRLSQALLNLLNNAAKFTEPGGEIRLSAEAEARSVVVRVRDNGIGMSAEFLPHVFDMFMQEDKSAERTHGGLGIGLTLAHSLVQMHGGTMEAKSEGPGQGSEMVMRLPRADAPARGRGGSAAAGERRERRRILVVEDNPDQAQSLQRLLQLMGHDVRVASDGPKALQEAEGFVPEVALVDVGLPGMNGYEVARALRKLPRLHDVLLVAQTGWGQEEDRRRSAEAGFDHHLVKPVDPAMLQELIDARGEKAGR